MQQTPKLDDLLALDVRWLKRRGFLSPGRYDITWSRDDQPTDSITLTIIGDYIRLSFRIRHNGGEWQSVEQVAGLAWTACHLGGSRPWFLCPRCGRRAAVLYSAGLFLCRHCHGRGYASQSESALDRGFRKVHRLRRNLGASKGMWEFVSKPKWMRWQTFNRKRLDLRIAEARTWGMMGAALEAWSASRSTKPPTG